MCGIVGIVHRERVPVARAAIATMCDAIRHRGPDDDGAWLDGRAALAMRRLSIIDIGGGQQPVTTEDGAHVLVFNGEIYNYRDLRRRLLARGHDLKSSGDAEPIVHLYEDEGPTVVESLRGMFAFAIWDTRHERLLLARDRFGIKPLYYVEAEWGIAFASELRALMAIGATDRVIDWNAVDAYFELGYFAAPSTPFRDVRKLEPGHWLSWRPNGSLELRRYWDLPHQVVRPPRDVVGRVAAAIDESVMAHTVSDVPVAAFLSGGLDSSAVVAAMAKGNGEAPHAFTVRYHGSDAARADETALAQAVARQYGARHSIIDVGAPSASDIDPMVAALDEPHADDAAIPTWTLCRAVAMEYKVALTGIGGDELFAGYRRHVGLAWAMRAQRIPGPIRRGVARVVHALRDGGAGLGIDRLRRFADATSGDRDIADVYLGMLSRLGASERRALFAPPLAATIHGMQAQARFRWLLSAAGSRDAITTGCYLDYHTFLADDVLALADRLSMAHGLELRVPFVDHELVNVVFPLPGDLKAGLTAPKRLMKRAVGSRLTPAHLRAQKRGFVGPTSSWLRSELRDVLTDELAESRIERLGYFNASVVNGLVHDHLSGRRNREGILWALTCFLAWHRVMIESVRPRRYAPSRLARASA